MKKFIILLAAVLAFSVASIAQTKVYAEIVAFLEAEVIVYRTHDDIGHLHKATFMRPHKLEL